MTENTTNNLLINMNKRIHIDYYQGGKINHDEGLLREYIANESLIIHRIIGGMDFGRCGYTFYTDEDNYIYKIEDNNCIVLYKNNIKHQKKSPEKAFGVKTDYLEL